MNLAPLLLLAALYYPEEAPGEAAFFVESGGAYFLTDRDPLAGAAPPPRALGLGFSYEFERVRLAWRARLLTHPDEPGQLALAELVSVERILTEHPRWRPFWRIALGLALDLENPGELELGQEGYFNEGPSAGFSITHGWGLDMRLGAGFLRAQVDATAFGGAGPGVTLLNAHLAAGWRF